MKCFLIKLLKPSLMALASICVANNAIAQSKKEMCLAMASKMNKSLPAKIDFLTTLQSTNCVEDLLNGEIHFQYYHSISNPSVLPQDVQRQAKASARAQYCSSKEFRNAIKHYVFDFNYFDTNRQPLYSFSLKYSDC